MRHSVRLEGTRYRIRPVTVEDTAFILGLRTDPERARFLHPTSADVGAQHRWLDSYFGRHGDYYFIIERRDSGHPEGTIGIYNLEAETHSAEWGRWIVCKGSLAGLESAYLIYQAGFDLLSLERMYSRTALVNKSVISFHDSFGMERVRTIEKSLHLASGPEDAMEHQLTRDLWIQVRPRIEKMLRALARPIPA